MIDTPRPLGQSFIEGGCGVDEVCRECHEKCGDDIACKHTCDKTRPVASNHLQGAECYPLPPLNRLAAMCPTELAVCQTAPGCSELLQKALNRTAPAAWMHSRQLLAINQCWACSEAACVEPGACLLPLGNHCEELCATRFPGQPADACACAYGCQRRMSSHDEGICRETCDNRCDDSDECACRCGSDSRCEQCTSSQEECEGPCSVGCELASLSGTAHSRHHCDITVASASSCQAIGGSYCRHADSGAETLQMAQAFPACQKELQACVGTPGVVCAGGNCTLASHAAVAPVHGCAEMVQSWLSHTGDWAGVVTGSSKAHAAARSVLGCIVVSHEGPEFADDAERDEPTHGQCDDVTVITACLHESPQVDESCKPVSDLYIPGVSEQCADLYVPGVPEVPAQCVGTSETGETCDLDASTNHTAECPAGCESVPGIPAVPGTCIPHCELHTVELPSCREEYLAVATKER